MHGGLTRSASMIPGTNKLREPLTGPAGGKEAARIDPLT